MLPRKNFLRKDRHNSDLRRTVYYSTAEGMLAQIYTTIAGAGSTFLTKYLLSLGAGVMQLSLFSIAGQMAQFATVFGLPLVRRVGSRKKVTVWTISAGKVLAFGFGILPFLFPAKVAVTLFLVVFFISIAFQAVGGNVWTGWMAGVIPLRMRGRFFSRRSRLLMLSGLVSGFAFSFAVDAFLAPGSTAQKLLGKFIPAVELEKVEPRYVFAVLFALAGTVGIIGMRVLRRQPPDDSSISDVGIFSHLRHALADSRFRKLAFAKIWWMLALGIGAPFWQPFMLKGLGMSITQVQIYRTIATAAGIVSAALWGDIIDRFGNRTALKFVVIFGGVYPFLWLMASPHNLAPVFIEAVVSGVVWAGEGLVWFNLLLKIFPREKIEPYAAIFSSLSVLGSVATSYLSGALFPPAGFLGLHFAPEQIIFAVGGLARMSAIIPVSKIAEDGVKSTMDAAKFVLRTIGVRR